MNGTPADLAIFPISRIGCTVPVTLLTCVIAMSRVSGRIARRMSSGSTKPVAGSTSIARLRNLPAIFQAAQGTEDGIVIDMRANRMAAVCIDQSFDGDIQRIGAS